MKKFLKVLAKNFERYLATALMVWIVGWTFFQVLSRYFLKSIYWAGTEEMARYSFIWMIMLGATMLTLDNDHLKVDILKGVVGDHKALYYVLNGVKRFITNAAYPGPCIFYCRDEDDGQCTAYIVDKFCEGYSLSSEWDKIGFKGSPVYDVFLDNVKVPKSNRIGAKGDGFKILLSESAVGKMVHGAICLGIMEACQHLAIKYANEKLHRNQPITKFPAIQMKIADICMYTESMRYMAYRCGQLADVDTMSEEFKSYAAMTKTYAAETTSKVALLAMNIMGAYGPMKEYSVERYMRDSLVEPHIEVVSDVQRLITARYFIEQEK